MIEDDALGDDWLLANPVAAIRQVSHDPSLQAHGAAARRSSRHRAGGAVGHARAGPQVRALAWPRRVVGESVGADVLSRWEAVLTGLESDRSTVADVVDWVAKQRLIEGYADRHGLQVTDARLKALDLQYHDLRPTSAWPTASGCRRSSTRATSTAAKTEPPTTTRAYFRGRCLAKWPADIVAANWDSLVFDIGRDPLAQGADDGTIARYGRACR